MMSEPDKLIPEHGGYRKLKSFQLAQLIYDITVRFCDKYIDQFSRTKDQMIQAARSGVQNIAEGSQASGTSKKTELRLTNVARASLEELRLDYENFLRHRGLARLAPDDPILQRFKVLRCKTLAEVRNWIEQERKLIEDRDGSKQTGKDINMSVDASSCKSLSSSSLAANGVLSLLNVTCYLLDRQLSGQTETFENEGGFTERLYRVRTQNRRKK